MKRAVNISAHDARLVLAMCDYALTSVDDRLSGSASKTDLFTLRWTRAEISALRAMIALALSHPVAKKGGQS